jgi:hypothetical protein
MSLRKKSTMTAKKISANRSNGRLSHGPVTPEGRERLRAAHTRHGLYSQANTVALACLGEDPAELERLRDDLEGDGQLASALEKQLREHLVEVFWRWKRAGRGQEGFALRLAKDANLTRDDRLHAQMMRLSMTAETLRRLAQSVAHEYYVTTPAELELMKNLHEEGAMKEMGEITLALFYQLQAPGTGPDGIDPQQQARNALRRIKEIFGLSGDTPPRGNVAPGFRPTPENPRPAQGGAEPDVSPALANLPTNSEQGSVGPPQIEKKEDRYPNITAAEWEARERPRQLLENILTRQVELCEAQRHAILKESLAGPSPYERAAEIALAHPDVALMQRIEESSFRQTWRISTLLLKIERQTGGREFSQDSARGQNVHENTAA